MCHAHIRRPASFPVINIQKKVSKIHTNKSKLTNTTYQIRLHTIQFSTNSKSSVFFCIGTKIEWVKICFFFHRVMGYIKANHFTKWVQLICSQLTGLEGTTVEDKKPREGRSERNLEADSSEDSDDREDDASIANPLINHQPTLHQARSEKRSRMKTAKRYQKGRRRHQPIVFSKRYGSLLGLMYFPMGLVIFNSMCKYSSSFIKIIFLPQNYKMFNRAPNDFTIKQNHENRNEPSRK